MSAFHLVLAFLAVLGALISWHYEAERRRRAAVQRMAEGLGWTFRADAEPWTIAAFEQTDLFSAGRGRRLHNLVSGVVDGLQVAAFDFSYVTGAGKSTTTWRQTVACVHSPGVDAPGFALRPESVFHKFASLFGYQDIDVEDDPDFSADYLLRGPDETAIRRLFGPELRTFFLRRRLACADAAGPDLFLWWTNDVAQPHEIPSLVETAVRLSRLVGEARPSSGA